MNIAQLLTFHPRAIPLEGIALRGGATAGDLDLPEDARIGFANPLRVELRIELVHGGILVQGRVDAVLACTCDRCLGTYQMELSVPDLCSFLEDVDVESINLTDDVREGILLVFPQHCLCREDCRGLCPRCGEDLNKGACGCRRPDGRDVSWQILDGLSVQDNGDA